MNINNIRGIWRLKQIQRYLFNKSLLFPKLITCNICNWSGRRFLDNNWLKKIECPKCHLTERHRLLLYSLQKFSFVNKKILHFAPEPFLISHFINKSNYYTADLKRNDVDLNLDISNMNSINDGEYDLVIASDVLEHVFDDKKAIEEIYRILKVGGRAVLTVPQGNNLEKTIEDLTDLSPEERERKLGSYDHYRFYGSDIKDKFLKTNFYVDIFDSNCVNKKIRKKFVLSPPILGKHPLVTNYRKIYHVIK
jgi:SAM-dependent methyltransferase